MNETPLTSRAIRSFVIRNGRMTPGQKDALEAFLPIYGIPYQEALLDFNEIFGNTNPVWIEIGFGNGDALLSIAAEKLDINFIGIEVHAPGVGHLLAGIENAELRNVRVMRHDAVEVLGAMIPTASVQRILLLFPDPWHKKRHHKRRILQNETVRLIEQVLEPKGVLHCATDWAEYAESMLEVLAESDQLHNLSPTGTASEKPGYRPLTRFEKRGLKLGHEVSDLLYQKS